MRTIRLPLNLDSSLLPLGLIALYVLGVAPSLGQALFESHAHRQTQTAYTAVLYAERGIDLLRPPLPVLGPPGTLPQEFPIFQALASLVLQSGIAVDLGMRLTGLLCFVASAILVFLLARRLMSRAGAVIALAAFLFNAHAWLYGRASSIEYLATASGLAFLYFTLRWAEEERRHHWGLALLAGTLGVLAKITTGGFYLLPALALRTRSGGWGFQRLSVWVLLIVAVGIGAMWSQHAEAVRAEQPAAAFLALKNQLPWFFGTPGQRLDIGEWRIPLVALLTLSGSGFLLWGPLAVARARAYDQRWFVLATLSLIAVAPLVLFNLYAVHDYYFAAVAPAVALGVGLGAERLIASRRKRWARRAMVGLAGAWLATIIGLTGTWSIIYREPVEQDRALSVAEYVHEHSAPDDWVVLRGWGWNSAFLYYARRQGLAVPDPSTLQDTSVVDFDRVVADPTYGPYITCDPPTSCSVSQEP